MRKTTPFGYVVGPYYTYELTMWVEGSPGHTEVIYVGRGTGWRAKTYYRLRSRRGLAPYASPKTHNVSLDALTAGVRAEGREIGVFAYDHGHNKTAARMHEKALIARHGRRDLGTGTLCNRNSGG